MTSALNQWLKYNLFLARVNKGSSPHLSSAATHVNMENVIGQKR